MSYPAANQTERAALLAHSAQILGVSPDANANVVRQRMLKRLVADDFMPTDDLDLAWRVLRAPKSDVMARLSIEYEQALREQLDGVAEEWESMSPAKRKECLRQLPEHMRAYPRLRARIERLQAAAAIANTPSPFAHPDTAVAELHQQCLAQAAATPVEAAALRHAWSEASELAETERVQAASQIRLSLPQLVKAAPELVQLWEVSSAAWRKRERWHRWKRPSKLKSGVAIALFVVGGLAFGVLSAHNESSNQQKPNPSAGFQPTAEQLLIQSVREGRNREYRLVPDADGFGEHLKIVPLAERGPTPTERVLMGLDTVQEYNAKMRKAELRRATEPKRANEAAKSRQQPTSDGASQDSPAEQ